MTSAARLNANRMNARKSTGPRTERGKKRVAGNAVRHGLAIPIVALPELDAAAEKISHLIVDDSRDPVRLNLARRIAEAQIDLIRVRQARREHLRQLCEEPINWLRETFPSFHFRRR